MDYSKLAATSIAQIADKGRAVSFVYKTQGTYAPATDTFSVAASTTTQTVYMVITDVLKKDVNETLIKAGDKIGLLANDSLTRAPKTGDRVTDGTETFDVISIEEIKPGDTVILYRLQLRRGGP